ncbi:hypothetical protein OWV82_001854 [Melia azedarach]|uniref:Uncharacterized protein n=1 Tax=Melia azedarach TaxID=155640 RepID=A0ACC1YZ67_MELAZ|nr:hypothetical protein OWV82_001854 [Melia azedarach]
MAASYHTLSNSFPTRSHPFTSEVDQHLSRLSSSQSASTSSLHDLQDLYDSVDKMLQLPLIQQALGKGQDRKLVDELLNGSLRILEIFSIPQNALVQSKESVQELQSVLRRRRGDETELTSEIKKYWASRNAAKKAIHKALKGMETKCSSQFNEEHVSLLKEVETITFAAFESMLLVISGPQTPSKLSSLSLVSKIIRPKRIACKEDIKEMNEFEKVDAALSAHRKIKSENIFVLQDQLKELECCIQDLEEGLESLSRRLIKARVSLLNILNN